MVDSAIVRKWVLDANDGIISTTGIVQGFSGAGASDETVLFAAMTLMVTGGLSLAGAAYAEAAQDRAAELTLISEEQRRLTMSPDEEQAQLRDHYVKRGLEPALAEQVAAQLMSKDPLAAQLETEYGILDGAPPATRPWIVALRGFFGFLSGALPLTMAVVFTGDDWRLSVALTVVVISLTITGLVSARAGTGHPRRAVIRSITIGLLIAVLAFIAGNVFEVLDQFIPQIDVDGDT
ncbi:VIT1/CCC1 transporter family protein [Microbacterium lacus]|uniref:VIT1/CCC1 transporter family protein n=1 Tax=Microbacterium lacus TaxID=415217 RepID=UPI00384E435D